MTERVLVLGGSWFLGRAVAVDALARGFSVTSFRRGISGDDVGGVRTIRGDRRVEADLGRLADDGPWDLVIDTSGYVPREVGVAARVLEPVTARWVFVSSVSAYAEWPRRPVTESSEILECPADADGAYGYDGDPGPSVYGFTKAGCERAVREVFGPDRSTILRPGVILGPHEYVGRLPCWLRRARRGGRILAPGQPGRFIQPVDVRDVAAFAVTGPHGVFNLVGPGSTMEKFLTLCVGAVGSHSVAPTWVTDEEWLEAQDVVQWTELPLWRTYPGTWAVDSTSALSAGFSRRSLDSTILDTWAWMNDGRETPVQHERSAEHGISSEKETAILGMWDARELDHCG